MAHLPLRRLVLYKHGVGYFERQGKIQGESWDLTFPRAAMDDVLKSLILLDRGPGQVLSVDFETPEDRSERLAKGSIHLGPQRSLLDLLRDLRGREIHCTYSTPEAAFLPLTGIVVGIDSEAPVPLKQALLTVYLPDQNRIQTVRVCDLQHLEILDAKAKEDFKFFLKASQQEEGKRNATLHLTPGDHDLLVGYVAPAPAWRVSYRLLYEGKADQQGQVLLQGWGLFDNQLDEDLTDVDLTLVAGMPISFQYRLYTPKTPERPLIEDEERTMKEPVAFAAAAIQSPRSLQPAQAMGKEEAYFGSDNDDLEAVVSPGSAAPSSISSAALAAQESAAMGDERGALFAYQIDHPISVARGQSAMVPICNQSLEARRQLFYNSAQYPQHPIVTLRLINTTNLSLERGPVTVLEAGHYAGEALIPFTTKGAEILISYAVELGVKVSETNSTQIEFYRLQIQSDLVILDQYQLYYHHYSLNNTLTEAVEVLVEHPRLKGYEPVETPEPDEQSAEFYRWLIPCPAHVETPFTICLRFPIRRRNRINTLKGQELQQWLEKRWLDQSTFNALRDILQLYQDIADQERHLEQLQKSRKTIHVSQHQIQKNLTPLDKQGEEGALRRRYVDQLNALEDQLAELATEEQQIRNTLQHKQQEVSDQIAALATQTDPDPL